MTVSTFLAELRIQDIHIWADGDELRCNAPVGLLTRELRDQLRQRKSEILEFLRGPAELSFSQQRLWLLDQIAPGGAAYVIAGALELRGALDASALERALGALADRHEALRTVFVSVEGQPLQVVSEPGAWVLPLVDLSGEVDKDQRLRELLREEASRGFDLARGPLFRAQLYRLAADSHVLLLAMHHIVSDGWSLGVLTRELGALYCGFARGEAPALPGLRVQYRDFARWQRGWLQGEVLEAQLAHWRARLAGAPQVLELPTDRARPPVESHRGAFYSFTLPLELVERLRALSRREGATLFMTLLSGFALLLTRYSGQQDLLLGTPVANRNRAEIENTVGCFINTLVLRAEVSGELSARAFLGRMREVCLDAYAHQDLPFERLVEEIRPVRDLSRNPVFQVTFALQNAPGWVLEIPGLTLKPVELGHGAAQFDLSLLTWETPEGLSGLFNYATDLFDEPTIARMARHWRLLLEAIVATPERRIDELPLLSEAERHQLLIEWNNTKTEYPADALIHKMFEAQARRTPDAVAVVFEDQSLTYRELDTRTNHLARYLQERGVGPDTLVALCVERSLEMVVGVLGILKAGGAYVPIDPDLPPQRIAYMLEEVQTPVLLTQHRLRAQLAWDHTRTICLDTDWSAVARESPSPALSLVTASNIAYVIYTSGSTGRPKGVMVPHIAICNHMYWMQRAHPLDQGDAVLQKTPFGFDASVWEFYAPLLSGARLIIARPGGHLDPAYLTEAILGYRVSILQLVPSQLHMLLEEPTFWRCAPPLRHVYCGGEPLTKELCDQFSRRLAQVKLHNLYGPTEATIDSTSWECPCEGIPAVIPIGRPIDNALTYIVSPRMQLSPIGVPGELLVGGIGLARGYLNQPELTVEKFIRDPFRTEPGARLYKTGDLVRYLPDGNIEFLGRIDNQVKIRGYRIELGEIEAALSQHPAIREVVVLAREDAPGDKRLVAYVVALSLPVDLVEQLRTHLRATLPQYMVPSSFVTLEQLPLTPNGKVDRKALPAPDAAAYAARGYEAPVGEIETALAQIWVEVLKLERVGRHDHFFELGGHSLLAASVIERMRRAGLHADVRTLFVTPTLAELAAAVGGGGAVEVPANRIPPGCRAITPEMLPLVQLTPEEIKRVVGTVPAGAANVQDIYPLAPLQEGILFHHLMAREGDPYLLYALLGFDSRARLDAYLQALQAVIDRHDILRTAVLWEGLPEPVQVVWRRAPLRVEEVSLDAAAGDVAEQLRARFDLRRYRLDVRQAPLLRVFIVHDAANARWVMLLLFHHLASDHTTLEVMHQEIRTYLLGRAAKLPAPLPFRNFVAQARLGVSREEHEAFFKKLLGDVEEPTAPFGLTDVQGDGSGIVEARREVDGSLAKRLRERARALGVSAASVCHLAWAQVLARVSGRDDVVFGTLLFGRMQGGEGADRVLGLFINTLPVRIRISDETVRDSVRNTHTQLAQLLRHEHAPLALAQRCSAVAAPAPLFSALLNYRHSAGTAQPSTEALKAWEGMESLGSEERTNYPLVLSVDDLGEGFALTAQVQSPVDPQRICALMHTSLERLVGALESAPATSVRSLDVLPEPERRQLQVEWNDTAADYPADALIHQLFEAQVARSPDAVAVEYEGRSLSYRELNARANQVAHYLARHGVGPEVMVGICVERSLEMVVGTLGILKAGGAYVPLDPEYPASRLSFMLDDTAAPVLLTQAKLRERLPAYAGRVISLDADWAQIAREGQENLGVSVNARNLAYVIYTSGSTGRPKGTCIEHRSVVRLVKNTNYIELGPDEVFLQFAPISFDASTLELWGSLLNGAKLVVCPAGRLSLEELGQVIEERGVSTLWLTAALFHQMVDTQIESLRGVRQLLAGGETLSVPHVRRMLEVIGEGRLINGYGPTENTTFTCCHVMSADTRIEHTVPIGRPISNTRVYILDGHRRPVPVGVYGELYIGGDGLAREYLHRPELTAEKFVPDPFSAEPGARLYRTGDLVRYRVDGSIEFFGRIDNQVKLRGYRIELGEIEAALSQHPAIREAVVLAREDSPGDKRLVAYVVAEGAPADLVEQLRAHLRATLPDYMVPSAFVTLEKLPLTPNGKVDRRALPAPDAAAYASRGYEAPVGEVEMKLAQIWAEVLKLERVGRHDHFFELGGHSLLAVSVIERMRRAGLHADVRTLFVTPTLSELAAAVRGESGVVEVPPNRIAPGCRAITPEMLPLVQLTPEEIKRVVGTVPAGAANVQDIYPLAPLQEGILFHHLMAREGDPYLLYALYSFNSRARLDAYLQALQAVIDRHDILRTAVLWEGLPEPVQVVWRKAPLVVEEVSLDAAAGDVAQQLRARFDPRHYRLDVREAPLLRVFIAEDRANARWVMLLLFHHLAIDHTAVEVMQQEIQARLLGQAGQLPAPLPFRNFVAQARLGVSREEHEAFFKKLLGDVEEPTAPFGLTDVQGDGSGIVEAHRPVDASLAKRLRARARALGVSAASVCHLAWAQVLSRVSGRDDVVFGTLLFGRMQGGEGADRVLGLFINTLPVRIRVGEEGVQDSVRATHAQLAQLLRHEHASLALAQRASAVAAPAPLFSALLNYRHSGVAVAQSSPEARQAYEGMQSLGGEERTNYPLVLSVDDLGEGFALTAQVQSPVDPQRICALMHTSLERLVGALESAPATSVRSLDVLPEPERRQVVEEWNDTKTDYPADALIHQLFEAQAKRTPERTALKVGAMALSYAELDTLATRIAHALRSRGVARGQRVGLCVERGADMLATVLGILKSGAAYVPLDPWFPQERLRFMAQDAELALLLSTTAQEGSFDLPRERQLLLDADAASIGSAPATPLPVDSDSAQPGDPAYVIYTSGSTGKPKGVVVPHRAVVNFLASMARAPGLAADDVLVAVTTLSFDIAVLELQLPLTLGATVVIATRDEALDGRALGELLEEHHATVMQATPATWRLLMEAGWSPKSAFKALVGGEALPKDLADQLIARGVELWNLYGPTETTVWSTCARISDTTNEISIGKPIANTAIRVLDAQKNLCPIGVPGELCIGGDGVSLGYWNRPELTAERFIADPFSAAPGATLYRTGDRARWRDDGTLEHLGRFDFQVKIRGYRIELGEIEAVLSQHPAVRQSVVLAREDVQGDKRLVAYVVAQDAPADLVDQLRAHIRTTLPEYMVPSAFVTLEQLPLTPNGKLDRRALPAPERSVSVATYVAPRTVTEEILAGIWAEVLKLGRMGVEDNFFELGGHSLLAMQVVSRVRAALGVELPLRELFAAPTIAGLSARLAALRTDPRTALTVPALIASNEPGPGELSFSQQRLWILEQIEPGGAAYVIAGALELGGVIDVGVLERALAALVNRHDSLRTVFVNVEGQPLQVVSEPGPWELPVTDLNAERQPRERLKGLLRAEASRGFDLERGPLFRAQLYRLSPDTHVLMVAMHHIIADGWSLGVITRELGELYRGFSRGEAASLPALRVRYRDFARWQRGWLKGEVLERELAHWRERLAGAPKVLELPTDRARPPVESHRGAFHAFSLPRELVERLHGLARREGATLFMTLLSGFALLLSRYSGQCDLLIGTPVANRNRAEIEGLIGFFVNTLVLRADVSGEPSVREFVGRMRDVCLDAYAHQDLPFERLVEELRPARDMSRNPVFQVMFTLQNAPQAPLELPGLTLHSSEVDAATAKVDLTLLAQETPDGLSAVFEYATDLFEEPTIARLAAHWCALLEAMVATPESRVLALPLLTDAERRQAISGWNQAASYPKGACLHERFEKQVALTPDAVALVYEDQRLSYAELNRRANRLAHRLRELGVIPDQLVGLRIERSVEMVIGILGILKAGGAYLPLDPAYPKDRIAFMLEDSRVGVVVTQKALAPDLEGIDVTRVLLDEPLPGADTNPAPVATADNLTYVIYTSGSTGKPKGVLITHYNVTRLFEATDAWYHFDKQDVWTLFHSYAFDFSVWELWGALLYGGRLVVVPYFVSRSPEAFRELLVSERVTVLNQTPSAFRQLIQADLSQPKADLALRYVIFGGEALELQSLRPWFERYGDECPLLVNMYGITETTVHVTYRPIRKTDLESWQGSVIGNPIPDLQVYILDPGGQPAPIGVPGEMYVGGAGVARGYLNRAELNAERFLANPFTHANGSRLYRTGDLARRLENGDIEYLGRIDHQVKIRGFRIELGEIEAGIARDPAVREVVVIAREDVPGEKRLVAYVVSEIDAAELADRLRVNLRAALPEYMVPSHFVTLDALPLTENGKVDRRALPVPKAGDVAPRAGAVAPRTATEEMVLGVFRDVLERDSFGVFDNFFDLGGHSLMAARLMSRLRAVSGVDVPFRNLFERPTVAGLAEVIDMLSWVARPKAPTDDAGNREEIEL